MRTVAGAVLILAAAVCLLAAVVAQAAPGGASAGAAVGSFAAFVIGVFGLMVLLLGLATDRQVARE